MDRKLVQSQLKKKGHHYIITYLPLKKLRVNTYPTATPILEWLTRLSKILSKYFINFFFYRPAELVYRRII